MKGGVELIEELRAERDRWRQTAMAAEALHSEACDERDRLREELGREQSASAAAQSAQIVAERERDEARAELAAKREIGEATEACSKIAFEAFEAQAIENRDLHQEREQLRTENAALRAALEPFARIADLFSSARDSEMATLPIAIVLFRAARAALSAKR